MLALNGLREILIPLIFKAFVGRNATIHERYKENKFNVLREGPYRWEVSSVLPDEGPLFKMSNFSLYFSSSCIPNNKNFDTTGTTYTGLAAQLYPLVYTVTDLGSILPEVFFSILFFSFLRNSFFGN